jgi:hypothetical protein
LQSKNPSVGAFVAEIHVSAIRIPTTVSGREHLIAELQAYINEEMAHRLTTSDFELYQQHGLDVRDTSARRRIHQELDQFIQQALIEQGLKLLVVPIILQRVNDWLTVEGDALHYLRKLTKALTTIVGLAQGKSTAPLDSWVRYKRPLLTETKALKKLLKEKVKGSHRLPDAHVLLDLMQEIVESSPQTFPTFTRIEIPFQFVQANPEMLPLLIDGERFTPAQFVYALIAWSTNRTAEATRQVISRLSRP